MTPCVAVFPDCLITRAKCHLRQGWLFVNIPLSAPSNAESCLRLGQADRAVEDASTAINLNKACSMFSQVFGDILLEHFILLHISFEYKTDVIFPQDLRSWP